MVYYGFLLLLKLQPKNGKKTERNFSSNFFAQKDLPGSEVFKNRKNFEKNWWEHGSFDFFFWFTYLHKKKICATIFKKNFPNFFSHTFLHILSGFDQIPMKNTLSIAICSLKQKKSKITQNLKKFVKMPIARPFVVPSQNPLGCEGHLGKGSQPCPYGQDS